MNDPRRNRVGRKPARKNNRIEDSADIYSHSRKRPKRRNVRRIVANVVGSLLLVISLVTMSGILVLSSRPFDDTTKREDETDESEYGQIDTSVNENVSYILVAGVDKSENLTDVLMVICFDIQNKTANILQIPRDTYVGSEFPTGKINAVYGSARKGESKSNALKRVLNNTFGLPIDHHVIVNLEALRSVVDIVGGVTITLDKQITLEDFRTGKRTVKIGPGEVTLNGNLAESWMRERRNYAEGDIGRIKAQRKFYSAFIKKMLNMSTAQMTNAARKCFDKIKTDMTIGELLGYAEAARKININDIGIYQVPGTAAYYRPPGFSQRLSYYSADLNAYIDLVYSKFNPYGEIKYEGINIKQIHSGRAEYGDNGQIIGELK